MEKLKQFGINGQLFKWFTSYLSDRLQTGVVNGNFSQPFKVMSGVAQGSRLGPLLFDIFINDLIPTVKYSNIDLFADDCRLYKKISKWNDSVELQTDLDNVIDWIHLNLLDINESKTEKITFSRKADLINFDYKIQGLSIYHPY